MDGEAANGAEALPLCRRLHPDLVVLDQHAPGVAGSELAGEILRVCPRTKVVIVSPHDDEESIVAAIRAGVSGFVLKKSPASEIHTALRKVAGGGTYLSPAASSQLLARLQRQNGFNGPLADVNSLSPREFQVLRLVAQGKRNKEVAAELHLEHNTIRTYRKSMMKKLGVTNVGGLMEVAHAHGLIYNPRPRHPR